MHTVIRNPQALWDALDEAGKILISHQDRHRRGELKIQKKEDNSPVSEADIESHRFLRQFLKEWTPSVPLLSEEDTPEEREEVTQEKNRFFWAMDPLDGTKGFLNLEPEYCIALVLFEEGSPIFSVLYAPALQVLYFGARGEGSFKREKKGEFLPLKIDTQTPLSLKDEPVFLKSRFHHAPKMQAMIERMKRGRILEMGSTLKFGAIAEEKGHIYGRGGPVALWDLAPGDALVRFAMDPHGHVQSLYTSEVQPFLHYRPTQILYAPFILISPRVPEAERIRNEFLNVNLRL